MIVKPQVKICASHQPLEGLFFENLIQLEYWIAVLKGFSNFEFVPVCRCMQLKPSKNMGFHKF